ncbi:MAG: hypothetical protein HN416_15600 [Nitrospina sp.]|jgi:hypothetical protein|nr:hypothetical protein [Nitrospina sp.]
MEDLKEFKEKFPKLYKAIADEGRADQRAVQRTVDAAKASKEKKPEPVHDTEAGWKKAWDSDAELRAEFGQNQEIWLAYCQAQSRGLVSIVTGGTKSYPKP